MVSLIGRTADEVWRRAASMFGPDGPASSQPSRGGDTLELLHVAMTIESPRERWISSRTPAMNPAFAFVEVFWIMSGRSDAALLLTWNPRLSAYCGLDPNYHGAYGSRLRSHFGLDQLDRVYQVLGEAPDSRQAVLEIWDSRVDLPGPDGTPANPDIPCNIVAMPKVRDGRLEWMQILRSNDLFLGLPHNLVQFTSLQEILAGWLGLELGAYHQLSDSLHVYGKDLSAVRSTGEGVPIPGNEDSLAIDRGSWDKILPAVMARLDGMAAQTASPASLRELAMAGDLPAAYENAVRIAGADVARRLGLHEIASECASSLSNGALRLMWERWLTRNRTIAPGS